MPERSFGEGDRRRSRRWRTPRWAARPPRRAAPARANVRRAGREQDAARARQQRPVVGQRLHGRADQGGAVAELAGGRPAARPTRRPADPGSRRRPARRPPARPAAPPPTAGWLGTRPARTAGPAPSEATDQHSSAGQQPGQPLRPVRGHPEQPGPVDGAAGALGQPCGAAVADRHIQRPAAPAHHQRRGQHRARPAAPARRRPSPARIVTSSAKAGTMNSSTVGTSRSGPSPGEATGTGAA